MFIFGWCKRVEKDAFKFHFDTYCAHILMFSTNHFLV